MSIFKEIVSDTKFRTTTIVLQVMSVPEREREAVNYRVIPLTPDFRTSVFETLQTFVCSACIRKYRHDCFVVSCQTTIAGKLFYPP